MERGKRWEIKNNIEKVERKLKYMLSDDNNARFGKYLTSLSSPSDILNCERGVQRIVKFVRRGFKGKSFS